MTLARSSFGHGIVLRLSFAYDCKDTWRGAKGRNWIRIRKRVHYNLTCDLESHRHEKASDDISRFFILSGKMPIRLGRFLFGKRLSANVSTSQKSKGKNLRFRPACK